MVISIIGIIVLQVLWVSKAIAEQQEEFANQVNAALNDVNAGIDEEEAFFYFESEFENMEDDLETLKDELEELDDIIQIKEHTDKDKIVNGENKIQISISEDKTNMGCDYFNVGDLPIEEIEEVMKTVEFQVENTEEFSDSMIVITEQKKNKLENISTIVRRYVLEHDFSGNLSDRLSKSSLDSLLKKGLKKHGVSLQPQYAIYNTRNKKLLTDFATEGFDEFKKEESFKKKLFPNDRVQDQNFELRLQFDGTGGLVWSGIQSIVLLCSLFTLLIFTCFGYSLHFIFKQKRMSQVKNDFINNMTHELKTPLASISLAASSIQHPNVIEKPEEIQRLIMIIQSEERRMNEHVERVLDMAALDSKELKMNLEWLDMIELVEESIEHIQLAVDATKGQLTFRTALESAPVNADKFHLLSALINILDNSVKYQNGGLVIGINLSADDNMYTLTFTDNGIGMKKSAVKKAFDKFYREETGNIHTRKGFGLGLSYVKSIIEAHGGTIELTSEVNKGTAVSIKLPKE